MKLWCCFAVFAYCCAVGFGNETSPCTTPNGEKAFCVRLRSCPILEEADKSGDPTLVEFVDASECGKRMYCCGTMANFTQGTKEEKDSPKETKREHAIQKLLPSIHFCGQQHTDDYFYNETETSVDEFPWLVLVYYDDAYYQRLLARAYVEKCVSRFYGIGFGGSDVGFCRGYHSLPKVTYKCTGVLISVRYALTSGNCASTESMRVALGQYDQTKKVGCSQTIVGLYCTEPALNVTVEKQIKSPDGDFLLLRLENKIKFTEFIRPICLPMNETIRPKTGNTVVTSGWGYNKEDKNRTFVKKRISHNITNNEECKQDNSSTDHNLCVTLPNNETYVCKSDRGGPLMYRYKKKNTWKNWYAEGIINVDDCAKNVVRVKRITPELVTWILENMED